MPQSTVVIPLTVLARRKLGELVALIKRSEPYPIDRLLLNSRTQMLKKILEKGKPPNPNG